ncbi:MAG: hypothetical protein JRI68_17335 [Deltaproteobacteria bacterium]|nr:hypothetical protein [Deltaproteobacteria bacterium]
MKVLLLACVLVVVSWLQPLPGNAGEGTARAATPGWGELTPAVGKRARAGNPVVVHVVVPLCHNGQVACGDGGLGNPASLRTNLYWGALYGARRFFDRPSSGWANVPQTRVPSGVLERVVYRRQVDGARWGRATSQSVEQLVVLDAIHGEAINLAVVRFFRNATEGGQLSIDDGATQREVPISVAGYAGHNRLMDGVKLPAARSTAGPGAVPSFVLACYSESYFGAALRGSGSVSLVMTRAFMAPEGYVVEATARALGDNLPRAEVRDAAVRAYARWQRISAVAAGQLFDPTS